MAGIGDHGQLRGCLPRAVSNAQCVCSAEPRVLREAPFLSRCSPTSAPRTPLQTRDRECVAPGATAMCLRYPQLEVPESPLQLHSTAEPHDQPPTSQSRKFASSAGVARLPWSTTCVHAPRLSTQSPPRQLSILCQHFPSHPSQPLHSVILRRSAIGSSSLSATQGEIMSSLHCTLADGRR
jgi:hypothetical protein